MVICTVLSSYWNEQPSMLSLNDSATVIAADRSVSGKINSNYSPPYRQIKSLPRTFELHFPATVCKTISPAL
jgi:hypothetical protein